MSGMLPTLGLLSVLIIWSIVSMTGLFFSLYFTNPLTIGPLGVTVWFLWVLAGFAAVFSLAFYGSKSYLHLHATDAARLRYSWRQGLLVAGWIVGVLALSSLHQLGLRDAILLGLLLLIVELYVRFRWP